MIQKIFLIIISLLLFINSMALAENNEEQKKQYELEKVVITGTKTPHRLKDTPVKTNLISKEDIDRSNANTVMEVLNDIPGIYTGMHNDVFGSSTWQAQMRGLNINKGYGLVLIDGQRVMGAGQSGGMGVYGIGLNQLPTNMIKRIEVVKGPGSALYGSDAMAGVINIITKDVPKKPTAEAGAQHGWYDVRTKSGKDLYTGKSSQMYFSYGDTFHNRFGTLFHFSKEQSEGVDNVREDNMRNYGLGKLHADLSKHINVELRGSVSKFEEQPEDEPEDADEESYRISGEVNVKPNRDNRISLSGYTYNWNFDHHYPGSGHGHRHGEIAYNQGELQYTTSSLDKNALTIGGIFREQKMDFIFENRDTSRVPIDETVKNAALYLQDEISLFQNFTLVPGVRYDNHSEFGGQTNPKINLMYDFSKDTKIRISIGRIYKSPTTRQLYFSREHGSWYSNCNPDLNPEKGWGYDLNIEKYFAENNLLLNLGIFRNDIEDKVVRFSTGENYQDTDLEIRSYKNIQEVYVQGLEMNIRVRPTDGLFCDLAYTYTDSENEQYNNDLPYTPNHTASLSPAYQIEKYGIGLNSRISYVGKQYTDLENSHEIDSYISVNGEISKKLSQMCKFSFEADNIFDSDKATEDPNDEMVGRSYTVKLEGKF